MDADEKLKEWDQMNINEKKLVNEQPIVIDPRPFVREHKPGGVWHYYLHGHHYLAACGKDYIEGSPYCAGENDSFAAGHLCPECREAWCRSHKGFNYSAEHKISNQLGSGTDKINSTLMHVRSVMSLSERLFPNEKLLAYEFDCITGEETFITDKNEYVLKTKKRDGK